MGSTRSPVNVPEASAVGSWVADAIRRREKIIRKKKNGMYVLTASTNKGAASVELRVEGTKRGELVKALLQAADDLGRTGVVAKRPGSRSATKKQFATIGIYADSGFWGLISEKAHCWNTKSEAARESLVSGLSMLDERLDNESSLAVFSEYREAHAEIETGTGKRQQMVRIPNREYYRLAVLANGYEVSLSEMAKLCISYTLTRMTQ